MAEKTLTVDIIDISVPSMRAINIAIINQPNPVKGYAVTYEQLSFLINFPQYLITDSATGLQVTGENIYDQFPDEDPSGGGVLVEKSVTENGIYLASDDNADGYSSVDVDVRGGGCVSGYMKAVLKTLCIGTTFTDLDHD